MTLPPHSRTAAHQRACALFRRSAKKHISAARVTYFKKSCSTPRHASQVARWPLRAMRGSAPQLEISARRVADRISPQRLHTPRVATRVPTASQQHFQARAKVERAQRPRMQNAMPPPASCRSLARKDGFATDPQATRMPRRLRCTEAPTPANGHLIDGYHHAIYQVRRHEGDMIF